MPNSSASARGCVVAALGGHALLRKGKPPSVAAQRESARAAARALAPLAGGPLVVTHGNGPQIGLLQRGTALPLDVLDALSEGMLGYWLEQALAEALPGRELATLLTRVEVARDDPAFAAPTKPVGGALGEHEARALERERGWTVGQRGDAWRRVVPSPAPRRIAELAAVRALVERGFVVVCAGGGGVPYVRGEDGEPEGVEAVIDKDAVSALLAAELGARALLLLTDVDAVYAGWGTPEERPLRRARPQELRALELEPGSMRPKVEAACRFVERTGAFAAIGRLEHAAALLTGEAGTRVER